jgi:hypothetical protein
VRRLRRALAIVPPLCPALRRDAVGIARRLEIVQQRSRTAGFLAIAVR